MKPITSRIKRSPLFSYGESPAKQTAKSGSTTKGPDKKIKETKNRLSYDEAWEQDAGGIKGMYKDKASYIADRESKRKKDPKAFEEDLVNKTGVSGGPGTKITEKIIPGEDKDIEFDLMTKKSQGTMLEPWEINRQRRSSDKANREISRAQRKMSKYGSFIVDEKTGEKTFKQNPDLSQRQLRKLEKAQSELKVGRNLQTNVRTGTRKGVRAGDKFDRGQRKVLLGERTEDQQKAQAERTQRIEGKRAEAEREGKSTGQAGGAVEVGAVNPFAGIELNMDSKPLYTPVTDYMSLLRSPSKMAKKGYTQKAKSPATKALKGAQNKLPQHLQDAIKSAPESPAKLGPLAAIAGKALIGAAANKLASSNKMRSGFKMKGYGKK